MAQTSSNPFSISLKPRYQGIGASVAGATSINLANLTVPTGSIVTANFFVDPVSGLDTNNGTSISTPWRTVPGTRTASNTGFLQTAWGAVTASNRIGAGSVIEIKAGTTHNLTIGGRWLIDTTYYADGTSALPITIRVSATWGAGHFTMDLTSMATVDSLTGMNVISGRNYIKVIGADATRRVVMQSSGGYAAMMVLGTPPAHCQGITLDNVEVKDSINNGFSFKYVDGLLLDSCLAHDNSNVATGSGRGFYFLGTTGNTYNCLSYGNCHGAQIYDGANVGLYHFTMYDNIGKDSAGGNVLVQRSTAADTAPVVTMRNSYFGAVRTASAFHVAVPVPVDRPSATIDCDYCVFEGANGFQSITGALSTFTFATCPYRGANSQNASQGFVSPGTGDFHLAGAGANVDTGTYISSPTTVLTDADGVTRLNPPDIGRYEFTAAFSYPLISTGKTGLVSIGGANTQLAAGELVSTFTTPVAAMGLKAWRNQVRRNEVETSPGNYTWTNARMIKTEQVVDALNALNCKFIPFVGYAQEIDAPIHGTYPWTVPATGYQGYLTFVASRFGSRVNDYELSNEPNFVVPATGQARVSVANYRQALENTYPAIKAGNPNATVWAGSILSPISFAWTIQLLDTDWANWSDGLSVHPYDGGATASSANRSAEWVAKRIRAFITGTVNPRRPNCRIAFTESGWQTDLTPPNTDAFVAKMLTRQLFLFRAVPQLELHMMYALYDYNNGMGLYGSNSSIQKTQGAYYARAISHMGPSTAARYYAQIPVHMVALLRSDGTRRLALWGASDDGTAFTNTDVSGNRSVGVIATASGTLSGARMDGTSMTPIALAAGLNTVSIAYTGIPIVLSANVAISFEGLAV